MIGNRIAASNNVPPRQQVKQKKRNKICLSYFQFIQRNLFSGVSEIKLLQLISYI